MEWKSQKNLCQFIVTLYRRGINAPSFASQNSPLIGQFLETSADVLVRARSIAAAVQVERADVLVLAVATANAQHHAGSVVVAEIANICLMITITDNFIRI